MTAQTGRFERRPACSTLWRNHKTLPIAISTQDRRNITCSAARSHKHNVDRTAPIWTRGAAPCPPWKGRQSRKRYRYPSIQPHVVEGVCRASKLVFLIHEYVVPLNISQDSSGWAFSSTRRKDLDRRGASQTRPVSTDSFRVHRALVALRAE